MICIHEIYVMTNGLELPTITINYIRFLDYLYISARGRIVSCHGVRSVDDYHEARSPIWSRDPETGASFIPKIKNPRLILNMGKRVLNLR